MTEIETLREEVCKLRERVAVLENGHAREPPILPGWLYKTVPVRDGHPLWADTQRYGPAPSVTTPLYPPFDTIGMTMAWVGPDTQ